jgi:hypothetical protein
MWIEATQEPIRVRQKGDVIHLRPGLPVEFAETEGRKLLARAQGRVKVVTPTADPLFTLDQLVRVNSSTGAWIGSITMTLPQPPGGTTKAGWWYCVQAGTRWAFVHESLLDHLTAKNVEVSR